MPDRGDPASAGVHQQPCNQPRDQQPHPRRDGIGKRQCRAATTRRLGDGRGSGLPRGPGPAYSRAQVPRRLERNRATQRPLVTIRRRAERSKACFGRRPAQDGRKRYGRRLRACASPAPCALRRGVSRCRASEAQPDQPDREEGHGGQAGSDRQGHGRRRADRKLPVLDGHRAHRVPRPHGLPAQGAAALAGQARPVLGRQEHAGQARRDGRWRRRSRRVVHRSYRARLRLRRRRRGGQGPARLRQGTPVPCHQGRRLRGPGRSRRPRSASSPISSPARCCWPSSPAR